MNGARTFVVGDIHGAARALRQCLERSAFNPEADHLISLGDVCDGWPETRQCIDELLRLKQVTYIIGNHDTWFLDWMKTGVVEAIWFRQGGRSTIESYRNVEVVPVTHKQFLERGVPYYELHNKLFVHAGIDTNLPLSQQSEDIFYWDRALAQAALNAYSLKSELRVTEFEEVYIGHTPIPFPKPISAGGVWLMDTGAGWSGCLSMMNIDTKEIFTSDAVPELYPGIEGRRRF